ncbi:hypothetical protein [Haladaptatus halobius]|uniref:hypothetical protein n=1 Tax=Haladaptatus halobius TaxID=2884875 RepID=UPI001D0AED00|nr:hypothetical protein [Haladaptatus halobius]
MVDDFPNARYLLATLDWAREEHAALGDWRRIDGERLRARLLSWLFARLWNRSVVRTTAALRRS